MQEVRCGSTRLMQRGSSVICIRRVTPKLLSEASSLNYRLVSVDTSVSLQRRHARKVYLLTGTFLLKVETLMVATPFLRLVRRKAELTALEAENAKVPVELLLC